MSFSLRERLCSSGRSGSSELGHARRRLLLRVFFMMTPLPDGLRSLGASGDEVAGMGMGKGWGGEGGGGGKGEVDQPQAQCLPRISENVPLERSHTRHGRNQCAPPSRAFTHLIDVHERATNDRVGPVGGCHRLLGAPTRVRGGGSGGGGAGECARHHPFIDISPSHHL